MDEWAGRRIILTGFPGYLAWRVGVGLLRAAPGLLIDAPIVPERRGGVPRAVAELLAAVPGAAGRFRTFPCATDRAGRAIMDVRAVPPGEIGGVVHLDGVGEPCARPGGVETRSLLDYARDCPNLRSFLYLSTAFVSGDRVGPFAERDFDLGQGFKNGWEARAFAAEREVRAGLPDLPLVIARPTFVVGDSRSGEIGAFGGAYALLRLIDRLAAARLPPPMIGAGAALAQIVPVDYVAAALVHLALGDAAVGRVVHLADPDPPTVWAAYRRCAVLLTGHEPLWKVGPGMAARALRVGPLRRLGVSPQIIPYLTQRVSYGTAEAYALLAPAGIVPPSFAEYAPAVVDFYGDQCDDPRFAAGLA